MSPANAVSPAEFLEPETAFRHLRKNPPPRLQVVTVPPPKIRILSDLHLEHAPIQLDYAGEDLLVIAGDVCPHGLVIHALAKFKELCSAPLVFVPGATDFKGQEYMAALLRMRAACEKLPRTYVLHNEYVDLRLRGAHVRVIGSTLWPPQCLPSSQAKGHNSAAECYQFVERALSYGKEFRHILVTHFAPSILSATEDSCNSPNIYECVHSMGRLIPRANLWAHGCIHRSADYYVGPCRVIANPRGISRMGVNENPDFDPNLVISLY